ncbi:MAG: hypothetical protein GKR90_09300 [Pseudomonadales bacterium]|nr:hypothetical protein [Pseudomonadales bacterium]
MSTLAEIEQQKKTRLEWLCDLYSGDPLASDEAAGDANLFDRENDFGLSTFLETYRPLVKLREQRGELRFQLGEVRHPEEDLCYADLYVDSEHIFVLQVRFEEVLPCRVKYWTSYPPLADGVVIRNYEPSDAAGCVALERACPMEMLDGTKWVVDRGVYFDDYLQLMHTIDASVVEADGQIVGFYDCALRPISYRGDTGAYCVYQHHYRVHPDYRSGSISQALAASIDSRRTFQDYNVPFPYSMIDPNNAHMQHMGFPPVEGMEIARISIPLTELAVEAELIASDTTQIIDLINKTHRNRTFFQPYDVVSFQARTTKVASYGLVDFRATANAVLGIWSVNERNFLLKADGDVETGQELRLAFVLDYGFADVEELLCLVRGVASELLEDGATHLCFLCDTRALEYDALASSGEDVQKFRVHTLPWNLEDFSGDVVYCDAVYC